MREILPPAVWMPELRRATDAWHRHAESVVPVMAPGLTLAGYRDVLRATRDVVAALEHEVLPVAERALPGLDVRSRLKTALLDADLAWLDRQDPVDHARAPSPVPPRGEWNPDVRVSTAAEALGVLYVLEGATLGGRIILRELGPRLGISATQGARYYAGYGERTGPMWKRFRHEVEWYGAAHMPELDSAVGAAVAAFASLARRFGGGAPVGDPGDGAATRGTSPGATPSPTA